MGKDKKKSKRTVVSAQRRGRERMREREGEGVETSAIQQQCQHKRSPDTMFKGELKAVHQP
jgi:hypothetical protein